MRSEMPSQIASPNINKNLTITIDQVNKIFHDSITTQHLSTNPATQKIYKKNSNPRRLATLVKIQVIKISHQQMPKGNTYAHSSTTTITNIVTGIKNNQPFIFININWNQFNKN